MTNYFKKVCLLQDSTVKLLPGKEAVACTHITSTHITSQLQCGHMKSIIHIGIRFKADLHLLPLHLRNSPCSLSRWYNHVKQQTVLCTRRACPNKAHALLNPIQYVRRLF